MPLREWAQTWWDSRVVERSTSGSDKGRYDVILAEIGEMQLDAVTRRTSRRWVKRLAKGRQGGQHHPQVPLPALSATCHRAARAPHHRQPCRFIDLPTLPGGRDVYLTRDEVDAIVGTLEEPHATTVLTLAYTERPREQVELRPTRCAAPISSGRCARGAPGRFSPTAVPFPHAGRATCSGLVFTRPRTAC